MVSEQLFTGTLCSYILDTLVRHGLATADVAAKVRQFIADNQTDRPGVLPAAPAAAAKPKR
jgi:hypothetical protein